MVENLPLSILAPFVKEYNPETGEATISIPGEIKERLENRAGAYTENIAPERGPPAPGHLQLIKKTVISEETEYSIDDQIEKIFGPKNREWVSRKEKLMKERGFTQDDSNWVEDTHGMPDARQHSDSRLFTVKMDNLPEGMTQSELMDELERNDCYYYSRVVVPRDRVTEAIRPWAFIKFERLRWAVMFLEEYQKLKVQKAYITQERDEKGNVVRDERGNPKTVTRYVTMVTNSQLTT